jgi:hypothetical protein
MEAIGLAFGLLSILTGAFWLALSLGHRSPWAQNYVARADAQADARRSEGYKVNVPGFFAWFAKSPLRAAGLGAGLVAFGAWFVSLSRS